MDNNKLSTTLKKMAEDLRKEAAAIDEYKSLKCAKVLIAVHGLSKLKERMQGVGR